MRAKRWLWLAPVLVVSTTLLFFVPIPQTPARADGPPAGPKPQEAAMTELPITQVILFNSGVGYFARTGEVTGNARVELSFPESDINDLLKSLTLEDFGGGRVETVSYESRAPVARTLASYAINLADNPTLVQILMQTRGEPVEVQLTGTGEPGPATLTGRVVSLEKQTPPTPKGEAPRTIDALTLATEGGLRTVPMNQVLRVKFQNAELEKELGRALAVLARSNDSAKKAVTLQFAGEGKRKVRVGYVVESPIWKTSYRLVLGTELKDFPKLQGWAIVENPTDEDWTDARLALVSGRPISFKMDLYNPLYGTRPTVEPELFASLRPPAYDGGLNARPGEVVMGGALGSPLSYASPGAAYSKPQATPAPAMDSAARGRAESLRSLAESEKSKQYAQEFGKDLSNQLELGQATAAATGGQLGDFFQYLIDHPVTVARQKSAMIPIVNKEVESERVSIYNPAVQAKHPLLGLKFKNTTGLNLAQGPITVFEGSSYAGDARVMDLQPGEERLIAYAIDLGNEVNPRVGETTGAVAAVRVKGGVVTIRRVFKEAKVYKAINRSQTARTLVIEHPNRTNQGYRLTEPKKPMEETRDLFRFSLPLPAGQDAEFAVAEERELLETVMLVNNTRDQFDYLIAQTSPSPELKAKLVKAAELRLKSDELARRSQELIKESQTIAQDQNRIRANLRDTPRDADVYKVYLKKLSDQESALDALAERQKAVNAEAEQATRAFREFVEGIEG